MRKIISFLIICCSLVVHAAPPIIWFGTNAKLLNSGALLFNDEKGLIPSDTDPTSGGGYAADLGSILLRENAGAGEAWLKYSAANTAWKLFGDVRASTLTPGTNVVPKWTGTSTVLGITGLTIDGSNNLTSPGLFLGPLGAVGAPTYSFSGDPNTGLYSSGTDTLDLTVGGSNALRVNSDFSWQFMQEIATPANPAANTHKIYAKASGFLYHLNSAGTEREFLENSATQTVTNKTIDADANTITNIENADIKAGAAIARNKLASGTASHVLINDGSGVMSSEATLAKVRGGSGQDNSSLTFPASGTLATTSGTETFSNKSFEDSTTFVIDNLDNTKKAQFQASGITTATTRTFTFPDADTNLLGHDATQTVSNKTLNNTNTATIKASSFTIEDTASSLKKAKFDVSNLPAATRTYFFPDVGGGSDTLLVLAEPQAVQNKSLNEGNKLVSSADATKKIGWDISTAATLTTTTLKAAQTVDRTVTFPDATDTLVGKATTDLLTNKTFNDPTTAQQAATKAYVDTNAVNTITDSLSLSASGSISISTTSKIQTFRVAGSSAAVTLSNDPFGTTNPPDGSIIYLIGNSDTNTVTIPQDDTADGCLMDGNITLAKGQTAIFMYSSSLDRFVRF